MAQGDLYFLKKWIQNNILIYKNMKFEQIYLTALILLLNTNVLLLKIFITIVLNGWCWG